MRLPVVAALVLALLFAGPAASQKLSLADRVAQLERQSANQGSATGQANVDLLNRLTQMQAEVQALRNQVEQLQNNNAQLKQQGQDQYIDIDTRLQRLEGGGAGAASALPPRTPASVGTQQAATPISGPVSSPPLMPVAGEQEMYNAALAAIQDRDFVASARGFQAYLQNYPRGGLAPNARYWLGQSYYVTRNYPQALESFELLLAEFPDSSKAPDAMLKRAYCLIEMGQVGPGMQALNRVVNDYPGTETAQLANSRLRTLSAEPR